ncbi:MAG: hypothetical protein INR71_00925 [Terriglobus roseus]|nr:hypothetical protein [Terriglobus roseus]
MTAEARSAGLTSIGAAVKMDDRKRAAARDPDDAVQPPKKQTRLANGTKGDDQPEWEHTIQVSSLVCFA